jgi:hypothetical protein
MMSPTMKVRLVRRLRAQGLGSYPSLAATRRTRSAVSSPTRADSSELRTREAVDGCTPAASAMVRKVTLSDGRPAMVSDLLACRSSSS